MSEGSVPGWRDGWWVDPAADATTARAILSADRIANGYALCDLEPPYDRYTNVAVGTRREGGVAACVIVRHPEFTGVVTHGDPDGLLAVLSCVELPDDTHLDASDAHRPVAERFYAFAAPQLRQLMAVNARSFRPATLLPPGLTRLSARDYQSLTELYVQYEASVFSATQLEHGVFYGVREGSRLVAAGGTAGLERLSGIAVVTGIFTQREFRGRGLGTAVTGAITADAFALGCRDACLDVDMTNATAIHVYERLGYLRHGQRWQGEARRR